MSRTMTSVSLRRRRLDREQLPSSPLSRATRTLSSETGNTRVYGKGRIGPDQAPWRTFRGPGPSRSVGNDSDHPHLSHRVGSTSRYLVDFRSNRGLVTSSGPDVLFPGRWSGKDFSRVRLNRGPRCVSAVEPSDHEWGP